MRVAHFCMLLAVLVSTVGAAAIPLTFQEGYNGKTGQAWATDDWDDANGSGGKYTNFADTSSDHGKFANARGKTPIFRFSTSGKNGPSMAQWKTFTVNTADGTLFDASAYFAWKGDYGNLTNAQNTWIGISLLHTPTGWTQFAGNAHNGKPGISLSKVLAGVTGSGSGTYPSVTNWVQDTAPQLSLGNIGVTQITAVITVYTAGNPAPLIDIKWDDVEITQSPEPAAATLMLLGCGLVLRRRRA